MAMTPNNLINNKVKMVDFDHLTRAMDNLIRDTINNINIIIIIKVNIMHQSLKQMLMDFKMNSQEPRIINLMLTLLKLSHI